jgi:hypothetical protein
MTQPPDQDPTELDRYIAWLAHEHRAALMERFGLPADGAPMWWFPKAPEIEAAVARASPSDRAAIVLRAFVDR